MQTDRETDTEDRLSTLQHTALITVSVAAGRPPLQLPALRLVVGVLPLRPVCWLLQPDAVQPPTPGVRLHVEVGGDPVVLRHGAAEVDDTTLVRALV